jgi:hypothetical protein
MLKILVVVWAVLQVLWPASPSPKGSASVNVIVKCLVLVKVNGNNPRKLLNIINENSEMNIKVLPLILSPSSVLNSLWSFINSIFHAIVCREGINQ